MTAGANRFSCLQVPLLRSAYEERAPRSASGDCGSPRVNNAGFAITAGLERSAVNLIKAPNSALGRPFTRPTKPPYLGRLALEDLLRRASIQNVALKPPP